MFREKHLEQTPQSSLNEALLIKSELSRSAMPIPQSHPTCSILYFSSKYRYLLYLIIFSNVICCRGSNTSMLSAVPSFNLLSNISIWQISTNKNTDYRFCDEFVADSVDLSFYLISGGLNYSISKVGNKSLVQNISSGVGNNIQNLGFLAVLDAGDNNLFESGGQPTVTRNGTLSFRTAVKSAGYAVYNLFLVNHNEPVGVGGLNMSIISTARRISFVISPAYVAVEFNLPYSFSLGAIRGYIARETGVRERSIIPTCSSCMKSASAISLLDASNCTALSSNAGNNFRPRFWYRAISLRDATAFLYFVENLLDISKVISWKTRIRAASSVAWTLNIIPKSSNFSVIDLVTVAQDSPPVVIDKFAAYSVGSPVQVTTDGHHLATFVITRIDNPVLFLAFPNILSNGTLTFTLAPQSPGESQVSVAILNQQGFERTFSIRVLPGNAAPSFALTPKLSCFGAISCPCTELREPSSVQCCGQALKNLSDILISEHITLSEFSSSSNESANIIVDNFASAISVADGYFPSASTSYSVDDLGHKLLNFYSQKRNRLPFGGEYASVFTSNDLYVYAAEMLTDSIAIFLDADKVLEKVNNLTSYMTATTILLQSIANEDATQEMLVSEIQEYQTEIEFLKSRLDWDVASTGNLHFMDRRKSGEKRVRFVDPIPLQGSQSTCDLQSFKVGENPFIVVSTGCELPDSNPQVILAEYKMSVRSSKRLSGILSSIDDKSQRALVPLIADFYMTDSFSSDNLMYFKRNGCLNQNSRSSCLAVRKMHESILWNHTLALWDFQSATAVGNWSRPSSYKPISCREQTEEFVIDPSSFMDLTGLLGAATLRGPLCKENTEWDTVTPKAFNVHNFIINNGAHEALQFDGALNLGLIVTEDIAPLRDKGMLPISEITVECWVTIDSTEVGFAGLITAAQSEGQYFRGWSLGYSVQNGGSLLLWAVSVETSSSDNTVTFECDQDTCSPGQWVHLVATYDGKQSALYVNGELKSSRSLCPNQCGQILYPQPADEGWGGLTPLVLGAYNNVKKGTIQTHIGSMKRVRIYDLALNAIQIEAIFALNKDLLLSRIQLDTFWVSNSMAPLISPNVSSIEANHLDRQISKLRVYGRFLLSKSYACKFSYFDKGLLSLFSHAESTESFTCVVPDWIFGYKRAVLSILICEKEECADAAQATSIWQRTCFRPECGFPNNFSFGLTSMVGTKTKIEFTTGSQIYSYSGGAVKSQVYLPRGMPTLSILPFFTNNSYYLLAIHDGNGIDMDGKSRLYQIRLINSQPDSVQIIQDLYTPSAVTWATCSLNGQLFFILGSLMEDARVYTWNGTFLVWNQTIAGTIGTVSVDCITLSRRSFLILARYFDSLSFSHFIDSQIFDVTYGTFSLYQNITLIGAMNVQHFSANKTYIVFTQLLSNSSLLFQFSQISQKFELYQTIETRNARKSIFFNIPEYGLFLAIAQSIPCHARPSGENGQCSVIYRFNGSESGGCTLNQAHCMFASITTETTLYSDVSGGQELGTWASMRAVGGIFSGILFFEGYLILGCFEADSNGTSNRNIPSFVYSSRKENLDSQLLAPSAIVVNPYGNYLSRRLYIAEQLFKSVDGQSYARLSSISVDVVSGLLYFDNSLRVETAFGNPWSFDKYSNVVALFFSRTSNFDTHLYVGTSFPGAIHVFLLDENANILTLLYNYTSGLKGCRSLKLGNDGTRVYSASYTESAITVYSRDTGTGELTLLDTIMDGQPLWDTLITRIPNLWNKPAISVSGPAPARREPVRDHSVNEHIPASCGEHFVLENTVFLALCYEKAITILNWENGTFRIFQNLTRATGAKQIRHFAFPGQNLLTYILVVVCDDQIQPSTTNVFYWRSEVRKFSFLSALPNDMEYGGTIKVPTSAQPFELYGRLHIAVAYSSNKITSNVNSVLYVWDQDQTAFVQKQTFNTYGAADVGFTFIQQPGENYSLLVFADKCETVAESIVCAPSVVIETNSSFRSPNGSHILPNPTETCTIVDVPYSGTIPIKTNVVQRFSTSSLVFNYDKTLDLFVEIQRIETVGAVDIELFSIPGSSYLDPDLADTFSPDRNFLLIANKQSSTALNNTDYSAYDVTSYLFEWLGVEFVKIQDFSGFMSAPEPWCDAPEDICNCQDTSLFQTKNIWGECSSYRPGGFNDGFCEVDGACNFCPVSCAEQCQSSCFVNNRDSIQNLLMRKEHDWSKTNQAGIRGATKFRHFQMSGKHYLIVGQSVCNQDMSAKDCISSGRVQPTSAILEWNTIHFEELTDGLHSFALRIAAGAVLDADFVELPSETGPLRLLLFYSSTNGLQVYNWTMNAVSGLKGAVDALAEPFGNAIYVIGEGEKSLALFEETEVRDDLKRVVSRIKFIQAWKYLEGLTSGIRELHLSSSQVSNTTNITILAGQKPTEMLCGPIPLPSGSADESFNFSSMSKCQNAKFTFEQVYGTQKLLDISKSSLLLNGTLFIRAVPNTHGFGIFSISIADDGIPPLNSPPLYFSVRVVPLSKEPSFDIRNLTIDVRADSSYLTKVPFLLNIRGGAGENVNRTLSLSLISLSFPDAFVESPALDIFGQSGYLSVSVVPSFVGTSEVTVLLTDDVGSADDYNNTCPFSNSSASSPRERSSEQCLCQAIQVQSGIATSIITFSIHINGVSSVPSFQFMERYVLIADAHEYTIEDFAQNITVGVNAIANNYIFVLSGQFGSGRNFDLNSFFDKGLPYLYLNGTLRISVSRPATMIFRAVSLVQHISGPTTSGDGIILLTFTLTQADRAGLLTNSSSHASRSCIISVINMNLRPSFTLIRDIIRVQSLENSILVANVSFATDISSSYIGEEGREPVTFIVDSVSNVAMFEILPRANADGYMQFQIKPRAAGISRARLQLVDNNKVSLNSQASNSSSVSYITINVTRPMTTPTFQIPQNIDLAESNGEYAIRNFATNISGVNYGEWQITLTILTVNPWNLLKGVPSIDQNGTLRLAVASKVYGSAAIGAELRSSGNTGNPGKQVCIVCHVVCILAYTVENYCVNQQAFSWTIFYCI